MNLLPSALPWRGLLFFPALLVFIGVLLFSTATLAFYVKQTISFTRLRKLFTSQSALAASTLAALLGAATPFCTCTESPCRRTDMRLVADASTKYCGSVTAP